MPETIETGLGEKQRKRELFGLVQRRRTWCELSHEDACEIVLMGCQKVEPQNRAEELARYILARLLVNSRSRDEFETITQSELAYAFKTDFYACLDGWFDLEIQEACSFRYREFVAAHMQRIAKSILEMWPESPSWR
jgi:hypothetical protein